MWSGPMRLESFQHTTLAESCMGAGERARSVQSTGDQGNIKINLVVYLSTIFNLTTS